MISIHTDAATLDNAFDIAMLTNELGYITNEKQTEEWLKLIKLSTDHAAIVAVTNQGKLCGWAVVEKRISLETGSKAEISGLVTGSNFRRLGVGSQLVEACQRWALKHNLNKIVVASNIERNESHIFYQKTGFSLVKTSHKYEKILT